MPPSQLKTLLYYTKWYFTMDINYVGNWQEFWNLKWIRRRSNVHRENQMLTPVTFLYFYILRSFHYNWLPEIKSSAIKARTNSKYKKCRHYYKVKIYLFFPTSLYNINDICSWRSPEIKTNHKFVLILFSNWIRYLHVNISELPKPIFYVKLIYFLRDYIL